MIQTLLSILLLAQDSLSKDTISVALHGLYEPDPVPFTFSTIGWPILAGLIFIILVVVLFFQLKKYRHNRYRRVALKELNQLNEQSFPQVFVVLKKVAIQAFGREKAGQLYGEQWLSFLETSAKNVSFLKYNDAIQAVLYSNEQAKPEVQKEIIGNAKKWVRTHAAR